MGFGQLNRRARSALWLRLGIRFGLTALALILAARFGRTVLSLFAPFLAAFLTAALLDAPIRRLQHATGMTRQAASLFLLLALITLLGSVLGFLCYAAGRELMDLAQNRDTLLTAFQVWLEQFRLFLSRTLRLLPPQILAPAQTAAEELLTWLAHAVPEGLTRLAARLGHRAMALPSFLLSALTFLLATYFLSADLPGLCRRTARQLEPGMLRFLRQFRSAALSAFGGYLKAQLLLSAGVFLILLVGFALLHHPYSLLLAAGLAVLDFIPLVGAGTVMVPWAFLVLFTRNYRSAVGIMVLWSVVALFRRTMEPKIVGNRTGLPPILSLVGIYAGMKLGGVAGMILAPILLLTLLNLSGTGLLNGWRADLAAAIRDIAAILAERPSPP